MTGEGAVGVRRGYLSRAVGRNGARTTGGRVPDEEPGHQDVLRRERVAQTPGGFGKR